jgi:prolyl oligopeptidase
MPRAVVAPPPTPVEPVTETLHGVEVTDPYRGPEDHNSPQTRKWIEEQTAYTRSYFDAIPGREQIRERVKELLALKEAISEPWNFGDRYFFMKRQGNGEQPVIVAKDGLSGPERILVDPADRGPGKSMAVGIVAISEYGRFLAYSARQSGTDHSTLEIFDVERGSVLPDGLRAGFYDARPNYKPAFWYRFGTTRSLDDEVFVAAWIQLCRRQAIGPVPSESSREFTGRGDSSCI